MMIDNEVSFTSLCYITVDYEGRIWLNRLADVEDDILRAWNGRYLGVDSNS